jgi:hypothetical protein
LLDNDDDNEDNEDDEDKFNLKDNGTVRNPRTTRGDCWCNHQTKIVKRDEICMKLVGLLYTTTLSTPK